MVFALRLLSKERGKINKQTTTLNLFLLLLCLFVYFFNRCFIMDKSDKNNVNSNLVKAKLHRCVDWLEKQNRQQPKKSLRNKNDIQFIIQNNAARKKFLLSAAEDIATVPEGIDEDAPKPKVVSRRRLRVEGLQLECEWQNCGTRYTDYEQFQKHVREHINDLHVIENDGKGEYVCLWDVCGHRSFDSDEIVRHMNYHAYHGKLLAIGLNARPTLNLARCRKDSTQRNMLPPLPNPHVCLWTECGLKFNAVQMFLDHVKKHIQYADEVVCTWAGCGAKFPRRVQLAMHVRAHTAERLIACYHCGRHFATNVKLNEHLLRQNVDPKSEHQCSMCGQVCATEYLLREHSRQHVSTHACTLCDMTAPSLGALANHVRYRHLAGDDVRAHRCPHCTYRAVTKGDLKKHIDTHKRKKGSRKRKQGVSDENEFSDDDSNSEVEVKKPKVVKKYACHLCPDEAKKVFSIGYRLTKHLVKVHGAEWPFGYSRFRYQISEDGYYRLTTTRYEILEVSEKIVDGYSGPKESINNTFEFNLEQTAEPTDTTPRKFEISLKNAPATERNEVDHKDNAVEITVCDVDEEGNVISSEVIKYEVVTQ